MDLLLKYGNTWLASRAKEPTTWKGLTILIGILGFNLDPELLPQIGTAVAAVIGVIEVVRKEKP